MSEVTIQERLVDIQQKLKCPKNQVNKFGGYNYRSLEDIMDAVKPLLKTHGLYLALSDYVAEVAGQPCIQAEATLSDGENIVQVSAFAGVDLNRKGMDHAQAYGASSSYARKYALNGLFLIDDTKDADATNTHGKSNVDKRPLLKKGTEQYKAAVKFIADGGKLEAIEKKYQFAEGVKESLTK